MNKKARIILTVLLSILIIGILLGSFGWRMFGFSQCDDPSLLYAKATVENGKIVITGGTDSSATRYNGYKYTITDDGNLIIGVKFSIFSFGGDTFKIKISAKKKIKEVWLEGNGNKKQVPLYDSDGTLISKKEK